MSKPCDNGSPGIREEVNEAKHKESRGNTEKSHRGNECESNSSSASHDIQDGSSGVRDEGSVSKSPRMHVSNDGDSSKPHNTGTHHITKIDVGNVEKSPHITSEAEKMAHYQKKNEELQAKIKLLEDENKNLRSEQCNRDMTHKKTTERVEDEGKMTAERITSHQQGTSHRDASQKQDHYENIPEMTEKEENIIHYRTDLEELRGKIMRLENEIRNLKMELRQREEELNRKEIKIIELEEKANGTHEGTKSANSVRQPKYRDERPKTALPHGQHHARDERPKTALPHGQHHARIDPTDLNKKIQEQKEQIETLVTQVKITKQECAMLANEKDALGVKVKKYENLLNEEKNTAEKEILRLKKDKDELLNRLSKVASDKLTHENTDITDLSDENRPIKLAEKISELYDNQYTDAFDEFKANFFEDKDAIRFLLRILMETHQLCKEETQKRYQKLKKASSCLAISTLTDGKDKTDKTVINEELSIELQQDIKRIWRESSKSLLKKARSIIRNRVATQFDFPILTLSKTAVYMTRCIDLCWTMNLQEKPMHLDSSVKMKDGHPYFDSEKFRSYTKTGQCVAFVVWPALYLFEGGVMLKKGIAQGSSVAEGSSDQDVSSVTPVGDQTS